MREGAPQERTNRRPEAEEKASVASKKKGQHEGPAAEEEEALDRGAVYRALAERYGWGPAIVGKMTLAQQLMYVEGGAERTKSGEVVRTFATPEEYEAWRNSRRG